MRKPVVGIMGASANEGLTGSEEQRLAALAEELGAVLARRECLLITGATTGLTHLVAKAFRARGGFALGVSPGGDAAEHRRLALPEDGADAIIYTGFGFKGRNVINVRSSDVVIIFGGATGTLNEFTIAYDEGKIIGVLEGSGGIADHVRDILGFCNKPVTDRVLFETSPETLVDDCLAALGKI
jgi:uncharacterized protein (TIGR00725 family)